MFLFRSIQSGKKEVNGVQLYYEKTGCGDHAVFLLPGALGKVVEINLGYSFSSVSIGVSPKSYYCEVLYWKCYTLNSLFAKRWTLWQHMFDSRSAYVWLTVSICWVPCQDMIACVGFTRDPISICWVSLSIYSIPCQLMLDSMSAYAGIPISICWNPCLHMLDCLVSNCIAFKRLIRSFSTTLWQETCCYQATAMLTLMTTF